MQDTVQETIAQKVLMIFKSGDESAIHQASSLIASLDLSDSKLRRDFIDVFTDFIYDPENKLEDRLDTELKSDADTKSSELMSAVGVFESEPVYKTAHSLHSLCHSDHLCEKLWSHQSDTDSAFLTVNAAWILSYVCGLWDYWAARGESLPIGAYEYVTGQLERSELVELLAGRHVRVISPLNPRVIEMIRRLSEIGVASIKVDSLCDEYIGSLIALGDETLELIERGAMYAERQDQEQSGARVDPTYTRWVSRVLNQHGLTRAQRDRWRFICLRAALAKTVKIKPLEVRWSSTVLKMVFCPVAHDAPNGLWVARSSYSFSDDRSSDWGHDQSNDFYEIEMFNVDLVVDTLNDWSRSKHYRLPYRTDEETQELDWEHLRFEAQNFRLLTLDELLALGRAGDDHCVYSGAKHALHLKTLSEVKSCRYGMLHSANRWGVYDLGNMEEFTWIEDINNYTEYAESYIRVFGNAYDPKIVKRYYELDHHRVLLYYRPDFAFRPAMSV